MGSKVHVVPKGDLAGAVQNVANWISNAQGIPADGLQQRIASLANEIMGQRQRVQFSKWINWTNAYSTNTTTDTTLWRFACHTGPVTTTIRFVYAGTVYNGTRAAAAAPFAYWTATTGLTGAGSTTTGVQLHSAATGSSTVVPNLWWYASQDFTVSPDTDYRFEFHVSNAIGVFACTALEVPRPLLTPGVDTNMVDATQIAAGLPITTTPLTSIQVACDLIWKRCGHPIGWWTHDSGSAVTRTTATDANLFDQTVTVPASGTPGWPCYIDYSGSLDSSNVAVTMWAYGSISAGSGTVKFKDQAGNTIGTITINSATPGWYSTTGNLTDASGSPKTTRVEPYIAGDGTHALNVNACGLFMKV